MWDLIFEEGLADGLGHALSSAGISPRCAERDLRDSRMPSPRTWLAVARALRTALALQRNQDLSLQDAALASGYGNEVSARKAFRSRFGTAELEEIAAEMGWPPLLDRFLAAPG